MINRVNERRAGWPAAGLAACCVCVFGIACVASLPGCEKKPEAAAPAPAPAPARPKAVSLSDLKMDPRVQFPQERLPTNEDLAQAIASLASAIAKGDQGAMSALLTGPAQAVLTDLVNRGEWQSATSGVEAVRVVALNGGEGSVKVGLAVQDPAGAYLLAWEGRNPDGAWKFAGLGVAAHSAARAADLDGVELTELGAPQATAAAAAVIAPAAKREEESSGGSSGSPGRPAPSIPGRPMPHLPGGGF